MQKTMHTSPFRSLLFHIVRLLPIACVLGLALFPFGWLGQIYPRFGLYFWNLFESDFAHAIGHSLIFFMLGFLLLLTFRPLRTRRCSTLGCCWWLALRRKDFNCSINSAVSALTSSATLPPIAWRLSWPSCSFACMKSIVMGKGLCGVCGTAAYPTQPSHGETFFLCKLDFAHVLKCGGVVFSTSSKTPHPHSAGVGGEAVSKPVTSMCEKPGVAAPSFDTHLRNAVPSG